MSWLPPVSDTEPQPPAGPLAQPEFDIGIYDAPEQIARFIATPALARLVAAWGALADSAGRLPGRQHFPPEKLRFMLGNLVLADILSDAAAGDLPPGFDANMRYRLFGSNFIDLRGCDLTGKLLTDHPDSMLARQGLVALDVLMRHRLPTFGRFGGQDRHGEPILSESVLLPLADDGVAVNRVLGGQFNLPMPDKLREQRQQARLLYGDTDLLRLTLRDPGLLRLLGDWQAWRGNRRLPARSDFQPEDLRYLLGSLFLLDVVPPSQPGAAPRFRYRLFGSRVAQYRGFDLTGRYLDQHPDPAFAAAASHAYAPILAARRPLWADVNGHSAAGMHFQFEALVLPLSSDGENIDMVLAAQVMAPGS